jgi:hypothetical protein
MKVKITTDRLPNKYPKGEVYEVENLKGVLMSLVSQNEAVVLGEEKKEVKKVEKKEVKKKVAKKTVKKTK